MFSARHQLTDRLRLDAPEPSDVAGVFALYSDPRLWSHFPSGTHARREQTEALVASWIDAWDRDGLSCWIVRRRSREAGAGAGTAQVRGHEMTGAAPAASRQVQATREAPVIGLGGCSLRDGWWNLSYRFAVDAQGQGFARETALRGLSAARELRPDAPVVAYLLEHNEGSRRLAESLGLTLEWRGPDAGNPDPDATRLVYADRHLPGEVLRSVVES